MLTLWFLGLFLLSRIGSLWCTFSKCPDKTIPYPYPHRPDTCYLFLDWRVTSDFWTKVWKRETPGWTYDNDLIKQTQLNLFSAVWDVGQARSICEEIGRHNTEHTKQYQHLLDYKFRLPIIESKDEDNWLYDQLASNQSLGTHFWIDLEYDPDKREHFWYTTGELLEMGHYFPDREYEDPLWEDEHIQRENFDNIIRICFEFFINARQIPLRGWHKRACAQAYSRNQVFEDCVTKVQTPYPETKQKIRRDRAPSVVVCELPLHEEAKTTPPSDSRPPILNYPALFTKATKAPAKNGFRRSVDWRAFYATLVFYFLFV